MPTRAEDEDADKRERCHLESNRDRTSGHGGSQHLQRVERCGPVTAKDVAFTLIDDRDGDVGQPGENCDVGHHRWQVVVDGRDVLRADLGGGEGDSG